MIKKWLCTFPKDPGQDSHHQMAYCHILSTHLGDLVFPYSTAPVERVATEISLHTYSLVLDALISKKNDSIDRLIDLNRLR